MHNVKGEWQRGREDRGKGERGLLRPWRRWESRCEGEGPGHGRRNDKNALCLVRPEGGQWQEMQAIGKGKCMPIISLAGLPYLDTEGSTAWAALGAEQGGQALAIRWWSRMMLGESQWATAARLPGNPIREPLPTPVLPDLRQRIAWFFLSFVVFTEMEVI